MEYIGLRVHLQHLILIILVYHLHQESLYGLVMEQLVHIHILDISLIK